MYMCIRIISRASTYTRTCSAKKHTDKDSRDHSMQGATLYLFYNLKYTFILCRTYHDFEQILKVKNEQQTLQLMKEKESINIQVKPKKEGIVHVCVRTMVRATW